MGKYDPYYSGGWKNGMSGATPITAAALNTMEDGISAALRSENVIAVYGQPINFNVGIGYYSDSRIQPNHAIPFVQFRAGSVETMTDKSLGVTVEEGKLRIVMSQAQTVSNLPLNILVFLI